MGTTSTKYSFRAIRIKSPTCLASLLLQCQHIIEKMLVSVVPLKIAMSTTSVQKDVAWWVPLQGAHCSDLGSFSFK